VGNFTTYSSGGMIISMLLCPALLLDNLTVNPCVETWNYQFNLQQHNWGKHCTRRHGWILWF